jgi:cytochrome c peroxidase
MRQHIILFFFLASTLCACKKEPVMALPETMPRAVALEIPAGFPKVKANADNPLTVEGIALGRLLFYDTRLSGNNKVSCASCHHQGLAFSDGIALTHLGVSGDQLERHAPALFNLAWADGFFWDGGAKNLESQAFGPITNVHEMQQDLNELEWELQQVPAYVERFNVVFTDGVKATNVAKALAQFQMTLISANSRYDQYRRGAATLTSMEQSGMSVVNAKCSSCHRGELFTDNDYHNNGLDESFDDHFEGIHQGRYRITHNLLDMGKFKTPSLRNVMLTAPYMHDGRFSNLDEVLDHYQEQGQIGVTLTALERQSIVAFLATLTDHEFLTNKKNSNPYE